MRILAITNMFPSAAFPAQGVFVQEQVKGLRAAGLDVRVMFVDRRGKGPWTYFGLASRIRNAISECKPDVIHVMYGGVMADQVTRLREIGPTVVTFHGSDLLGENLSGWSRKMISRYGVYCSRKAARAAQGVVVVARHLLRALNEAVAPENARVIPCGIDLERFRPMDPFACKLRLGWDPRSFHVLFASGNGDPVKRPWLACAAVAKMNREGRKAELHFLSGVQNSEVPVWLNAGDALLLTSLHEGSPTVVKEALACGLPVVSVDVGDVAERIGRIQGCYIAPAEPEILAEKLLLVRQHGKRVDCRAQITELSSLHAAQKLAEYYRELVHRHNPQRSAEPLRRISLSLTPVDDAGRGFESCERRGQTPIDSPGKRVPAATQSATNPH